MNEVKKDTADKENQGPVSIKNCGFVDVECLMIRII